MPEATATIIGCLLRVSIRVHTERKIRGQISGLTLRKNPQISLSVFQQRNGNLQTRTPRTCKTLHYWQSQESQDRTGSSERQSVNTRKHACIYFVLTFIFPFFLGANLKHHRYHSVYMNGKENEANYACQKVSNTRKQVSTDGQGCRVTLSITSASPWKEILQSKASWGGPSSRETLWEW